MVLLGRVPLRMSARTETTGMDCGTAHLWSQSQEVLAEGSGVHVHPRLLCLNSKVPVENTFNASTGEAEAGRHEFGANLIYIPRQPALQKETLSRNPAPLDFSCHSPQLSFSKCN